MFKFPFFRRKEKEKAEEKPVYVFEDSLSTNSLANRAYGYIERLSSIGPRLAATTESRMAANNIAGLLEKYTESVSLLPFKADRSRAYLWTKILAVLLPVSSLLLLIGLPYLALIAEAAAVFVVFSELADLKGVLFSKIRKKKDEGTNVKASIEPEGEAEQTVIISAHHDSAFLYNRKEHVRDVYLPFIGLAYTAVLTLFMILHEALRGELFRFNLPSLFPLIFILVSLALSIISFRIYSLYSMNVSPGVGDNLSGVGIALSLAEYFSRRKLKRTRVEIVSFDAEECGCQGSAAFYEENSYDENTVNINIDGIYSEDDLTVISIDGNGLVHLDSALSSALAALSRSMGYKMKEGGLSFMMGATDSSSAARAGIRSTCITGMTGHYGSNIAHSEEDTVDKIEIKALETVISIVIKYVESFDKTQKDDQEDTNSLLDGRKYRLSPRE